MRGVRLAVEQAGQGRTFVWGHGLTSSRASEDARGLYGWSGLTDVVRLVRYDARGHGESEATPDPGDYRWERLAEDMLALADAVGAERFVAGGASMGAATTLHAAVAAPDRVEAMVIVIPPTAWATRRAQAALYEERAARVEEGGLPAYLAMTQAAPIAGIFAAEPELARRVPAIAEASLATVMRGAAASDLPEPDRIRALSQPALILAWDPDPGHPVSTAEELARLLPDARLHVARDLGAVRGWHRIVREFLTGLPA